MTKSDEAIAKTALAVSHMHNVLAVALAALAKQQSGHPSEARDQVLRAFDLLERASPDLEAMLSAVQMLPE